MKDREYRELQLSRSQLVSIFLGMLVVGVFIFLLGISVGRKQAQIAGKSPTPPQKELEQVKEKAPLPAEGQKSLISEEIRSLQKAQEEAKEEKKQQPVPEAPQKTLYYIQVAALNSKEAALTLSEKFKQEGYPSFVLDPFPSDRRAVFRVRVGAFETKEKAEEVKKKLMSKSKKKLDYFIVRD